MFAIERLFARIVRLMHASICVYDEDDIIFRIICNDENTYIMDLCCLGKDSMTASQRLVRQHA